MHEMLGCAICRRQFDDFRKTAERGHQRFFVDLFQAPEVIDAGLLIVSERFFFQLPKHARNAGVRILDVVDGVVVRPAFGEFEVEVEMLVIQRVDMDCFSPARYRLTNCINSTSRQSPP